MKKLIIYLVLVLSLFAKEKVTLATDPFEPFYGPELPNNGYLTEIVVEAFKVEGIEVEIDFVPWKRAYELAQSGHYDGLLGAFYTEEREQYFLYTNPVVLNRVALFSKKNLEIKYKTLDQLSKYRIGIVRDYSYSEEFDMALYLDKFESPSSEKNINLLVNDRVEIIAGSEPVINHILKEEYSMVEDEVEVIGYLSQRWLHVLISKQNSDANYYIKKFNNGLNKIKMNGLYNQILNKHGVKE